VYRGDKAGKDRFTNRQGVFHAGDKEVAEKYASGETYELFLNIEKLLMLDEKSFINTREQINDMMYNFMEMDESELENNTQFQTLLVNYLAFRNEEGSDVRDFYNSFLPEVSDETELEELRDIMFKSLHDANTFEWRQIDYKDIDILNPYICFNTKCFHAELSFSRSKREP
jgi:ribosomal protein S18